MNGNTESKLNFVQRAIRKEYAGDKPSNWNPHVSVSIADVPIDHPTSIIRSVTVGIDIRVRVDAHSDHIDEAIKQAVSAINKKVYGDLAPLLRDIRHAVYEQNSRGALSAIDKLHDYIDGRSIGGVVE